MIKIRRATAAFQHFRVIVQLSAFKRYLILKLNFINIIDNFMLAPIRARRLLITKISIQPECKFCIQFIVCSGDNLRLKIGARSGLRYLFNTRTCSKYRKASVLVPVKYLRIVSSYPGHDNNNRVKVNALWRIFILLNSTLYFNFFFKSKTRNRYYRLS